jgi:hypothetical protein
VPVCPVCARFCHVFGEHSVVARPCRFFFNNTKMSRPEITYTKLFINNEWRDAIAGGTFETVRAALRDRA